MAETTFEPGADRGDSVATIRLVHATEIFRFCVNLLDDQVEFHTAGRGVLVQLREHLGADRFDPMAKSLLGEQRYTRLAEYFDRDSHCCACENGIRSGAKRWPAGGHQAYCYRCKKIYDDERARAARATVKAAVKAAVKAGRAVNEHGVSWWLHDCGTPMASTERPGPHACPACGHAPAPWAPLWTRAEASHA